MCKRVETEKLLEKKLDEYKEKEGSFIEILRQLSCSIAKRVIRKGEYFIIEKWNRNLRALHGQKLYKNNKESF